VDETPSSKEAKGDIEDKNKGQKVD
jgi:hypothetical protein